MVHHIHVVYSHILSLLLFPLFIIYIQRHYVYKLFVIVIYFIDIIFILRLISFHRHVLLLILYFFIVFIYEIITLVCLIDPFFIHPPFFYFMVQLRQCLRRIVRKNSSSFFKTDKRIHSCYQF